MIRGVIKWALIGGTVAGVAPALGWAYRALVRAGDGGGSATMLVSESIAGGLAATALAFVAATALGRLGAGRYGERTGYALAGFALAGVALAQGSVMGLLRWAPAPRALWMLAGEGVIVGALGVALAWAVGRAGARHEAALGRANHHVDAPLSAQGALGFAAALAAGLAVSWLVAREPMPGQTLAAGVFAGIGAATAARVAAVRCAPVCVVAALGALAVGAPIAAGLAHGGGALRAIYEQKMIGIGLLTPLDWVAGALLGTPVGVAWAASLTDKRAEKAAAGAGV